MVQDVDIIDGFPYYLYGHFQLYLKRQYWRFVAHPSYSVNIVGDIGSGETEGGHQGVKGGIRIRHNQKR
jgi:hypothetical protein